MLLVVVVQLLVLHDLHLLLLLCACKILVRLLWHWLISLYTGSYRLLLNRWLLGQQLPERAVTRIIHHRRLGVQNLSHVVDLNSQILVSKYLRKGVQFMQDPTGNFLRPIFAGLRIRILVSVVRLPLPEGAPHCALITQIVPRWDVVS